MRKVFLTCIALWLTIASVYAQSMVTGYVYDSNQEPLPFAKVSSKSGSNTITNDKGFFSLQLTEGKQNLTASYLGYSEVTKEVQIAKNMPSIIFVLEVKNEELNEVNIYGQMVKGQAKALNTQKNTDNIVNIVDAELFMRYPDVSAAETVQRLPGLSITRDQGEGEFVSVCGVSEQLNLLTINGERLPSVEPDAGRAVGLDLVQSFLVEKIKVSKSLTPDMDGDAIGGVVDFQLREAKADEAILCRLWIECSRIRI